MQGNNHCKSMLLFIVNRLKINFVYLNYNLKDFFMPFDTPSGFVV